MALLQYRAAAAGGTFTQLFYGFILIVVMREFFFSSGDAQPLTLQQTISYIWLGQAMLGMMPWDGDREVIEMVKNGDVSYELCRPLDLFEHWFCRLIALRAAPTLITCLPIFAVASMLPKGFSMHAPPSIASFLAWFTATLGALLLGCAISNIISISALWTIAGEGMRRLVPALVILLSGSIVPLAFFPQWAQGILKFLPFSGLVDVPNQFFIGSMDPGLLLPMLLKQLSWTIIISLAGKALTALAMKRLVIQGG